MLQEALMQLGYKTTIVECENTKEPIEIVASAFTWEKIDNSVDVYKYQAALCVVNNKVVGITELIPKRKVATVTPINEDIYIVDGTVYAQNLIRFNTPKYNLVLLTKNISESKNVIYHKDLKMYELKDIQSYLVEVRLSAPGKSISEFYPEVWHKYSLIEHPKTMYLINNCGLFTDIGSGMAWPASEFPEDKNQILDFLEAQVCKRIGSSSKHHFLERALC